MRNSLGKVLFWGKRLLQNPGELGFVARRLGERIHQRLLRRMAGPGSPSRAIDYSTWIARQWKEDHREGGIEAIPEALGQPGFLCVIRCEEGAYQRLGQTLLSLSQQAYPVWQAWIMDKHISASVLLSDFPVLKGMEDRLSLFEWQELDGRLAQSNCEWVIFTEAGDLLSPCAMTQVAQSLAAQPEADLFYTDEDGLDSAGRHTNPLVKPDWSPEYLLSCDYIGRAVYYRKDCLGELGELSSIRPSDLDYELALRFTETPRQIAHISQILYTRSRRPAAQNDNEQDALERAIARRGLPAKVRAVPTRAVQNESVPWEPGLFTLEWQPTRFPLTSIIILTRDQPDFLRKSLSSIFQRTIDARFEVILVDNGSRLAETRQLIDQWKMAEPERFHCYQMDIPFNFSELNNRAVEKASGELLLFLNNDTEVISPDWILQLAGQALQPGIGCVAPLLLYPDQTVQHAGIALDHDSAALHVHKGLAHSETGYMGRLASPSNFSAVSAACMMIQKEIFLDQRGFDERFAVAFGDVELCLRLAKAGYRHVIMPQVRLYHFESATRGYENSPEKLQRFRGEKDALLNLWPACFTSDPFFDSRLHIKGRQVSWRVNNREEVIFAYGK